jgi:hypothetical protein
MLMGRKNTTFREPVGWLARLIHSLVPRLVFMPYAIRNYAQEIAGLVFTSALAIAAFGVAYFVSVSGLVGEAGTLITPILSILLLLYLLGSWWSAARSLGAQRNSTLHGKDATALAKLLAAAILIPVITGFAYEQLNPETAEELRQMFSQVIVFSAWKNLALLLGLSVGIIGVSFLMLAQRLRLANPITEVCEYRENLQESVHPNEIFINIESIVLANRRYKEIPNRIYREFDPVLQEQSQGKGSFRGQLLLETQPEYVEIPYSDTMKLLRVLGTGFAQLLLLASAVVLVNLVNGGYELYAMAAEEVARAGRLSDITASGVLEQFGVQIASLLTQLFAFLTLLAGGRILERGTFFFWSEMQFSSLLMWMKTEGTYTESKISTGMSIHDSTRSENVVVRSSITPWLITSRITSSIFAVSGTQNLELPRHILQMNRNEQEMNEIVGEIRQFLRERESIASINNEADLGNAERIFQVNQQTRAAMPNMDPAQQRLADDQAAGKLRLENEESGAGRT